MSKPRFYVTTAIAYPNGRPHMGHAYEAIATDVIARFKRLDGFDVRFQTILAQRQQLLRRVGDREQPACGFVDAHDTARSLKSCRLDHAR